MKRYRVAFKSGGVCILWASCKRKARILAQAAEINHGNNYDVIKITVF